ncbi:MAG TPA: hypothetical protein VN456_13520 [Desulfosporosinus sp.]|nr:hypothetical protein [Desulfosporosinus sp.]
MRKKVLVLSASPRKGGNSDLLNPIEKRIIYGTGIWKNGDVQSKHVMKQAFDMGKSV